MNRLTWILSLGLMLVVIGCSKPKLAPEYNIVEPEAGFVKVQVSTMKAPEVRFFTYKYKGRNIDFMVIKYSDTDVRTFLDADYLCYKSKMGFEVKDHKLICRHHGFAFDLLKPNSWKGNHVPIALKSTLKNGYVIISEESLKKAYRFFR